MFLAFVASIAFLSRLGMPTSLPEFGMLALWGAAILGYQVSLGRIRTVSAADLLQMAAFITDLTFLTVTFALIGGAWWVGAATHSFIATFSLASLPKRRAVIVTGYAIFAYVALVYIQATGLIAGRPFLGVPVLAGNPPLAVIVAVFGLIPMVASVAVQNTFVRIMRRAQERYRSLLETAPYMIFSTDIRGIVVSVNAATVVQSGRSNEQILRHPFTDFVFPEDRDLAEEHLRAAALGTSEEIELRYRSANGACLWVCCTCNPIREDGRITGVLVIARDLTAAKHNEIALREREDELRQSQKMEAIGLLAGGVAHDFNNLLTVIELNSQFVLEEMSAGDPRRDDVEEIRKAGGVAASLTRQLLAFSRKQELQPRVLDLNGVVTAMEKLLQRLIGVNITIRTLLTEDLRLVNADPGQLEQIVMNLCINARDAMTNGGNLTIETANVTLGQSYVETHPRITPGPYVMLSVTDTGAGMDEATMAHVFEPFFTTKTMSEGTGLGLSTVYGIVNQSGGSVEVHSEIGQGTVFTIYFPAVIAEFSEQTPVKLQENERTDTETILLVDDADALRSITYRALSKAGYTVLSVDGGLAALRLQAEHPGKIALLLTDVIMPEMTGPEVARRVREQRPGIRILFMSGYAEDSVLNRANMGDGVAFLEKPFSSEQLLRSVRAILTPT